MDKNSSKNKKIAESIINAIEKKEPTKLKVLTLDEFDEVLKIIKEHIKNKKKLNNN